MRLCPKCGVKTEEARCPDDGTATLVLAQNPESRLAQGTEINGRYRVDQLIGQGGFGSVYKATHLTTSQEMAIKVLGVSLDDDDSELIQRFFAEAEITAALKHHNTIRVFDFGQTEGGALYIAMELLTGRDLNDLLKERRAADRAMTQEETISIASQTLRSLAEAHMAGLVHRDLKPHNIFLNEVPGDDPMVKVLDFGIAKRLGSNLTGTGQAFGTPSYMSPEQAQNKPIDARSDIYSLGAVMYQCISGHCPFEGDNPLAVLLAHVTDKPPDLRTRAATPVSEEFVQVIEQALCKSPEDRFESAIAMRQVLSRLRGGATVDAIGAPTRLGMGNPPQRQERTSSGTSQPIEIDDAGTDDQTAAYNVPRDPVNAEDEDIAGVADAGAEAGPGRTEAFFVRNEATEVAAEEAAATPAAASGDAVYEAPTKTGKRGLGLVVALGLAILLLVGSAAAVLLGGQDKAPPPVAAEPAVMAEAMANVTPPAAVDAGVAEEPDAGPAQADVPVDLPPPAPVEVEVEVRTTPAGATVEVDGKVLGRSPLKIKVSEDKPVRARLSLTGYTVTEVMLAHSDTDGRTVKLNAQPVNRKVKRPAPPKRGLSSTHVRKEKPTTTRRGKSALEERL